MGMGSVVRYQRAQSWGLDRPTTPGITMVAAAVSAEVVCHLFHSAAGRAASAKGVTEGLEMTGQGICLCGSEEDG
jgi:hypothetical protein